MNFAKLAALASAIAVLPVAANAQDVGATVFGNDDAPIGTVETNEAGIVTVNTGKHLAPLPANLLAEREGKWSVNATQAQIDGMMDAQVQAATDARDAALVTGAAVVSAQGRPAGNIFSIDDTADAIIIRREAGIITLKREHFAVNAEGALMALFTLDQIDANTVEVPEGAQIVTSSEAAASTDAS